MSYDEHLISKAGGDGEADPVKAAQAHRLKRVRGELKSLGKHLDSWESETHTTVTIRFMRQWIARLDATVRGGE